MMAELTASYIRHCEELGLTKKEILTYFLDVIQ